MSRKKLRYILGIVGILIILCCIILPVEIHQPSIAQATSGVDLACNRRCVASGNETDDKKKEYAFDGNPDSRWASNHSHDAWIYVDLGSEEKFNKVVLLFERAYALKYEIMVSNDALVWQTVAKVDNSAQKVESFPYENVIQFPQYLQAKFVKFQGIERDKIEDSYYGYSIYSFEVYGQVSLALDSAVTVSSYENEEVLPANAITDNYAHTRWASTVADNQWVNIDLGSEKTFDRIKIRWEVSFARIFAIYASNQPIDDINSGKLIYKTEAGLGEVDDINLVSKFNIYNDCKPVSARYIKIDLIQREVSEHTKKTGRLPFESTFSIYSFELYSWQDTFAVNVGSIMEFSKNARAWGAMGNMTVYDGGLILAPNGYPNVASDDKIDQGIMDGFESYAVYNPAVIYDDENQIFHMVYRSELPDNFARYFNNKNKWGHVSCLSYAYSKDGVNYTRGENNPIAFPTINEESGGGLEDPRMFRIRGNGPDGKDTYYVTYTMYDNHMTREGMIFTTDFKTWTKVGRLAPDYDENYKSGTYLTDPNGDAVMINDPRPNKTGKVYMIYLKDGGYTKIGFTKDVTHIKKEDIIDVGKSGFSNKSIEAMTGGNESCMALTNIYGEDDQNIYLMYGGGLRDDVKIPDNVSTKVPCTGNNPKGWFYALGVLKTTKSNPFELMLGDLDFMEPFLYPTDTEKINYGLFDKCMFADTMIRQDDLWYFYYGAGDMYIQLVTAKGSLSAASPCFTATDNIITAQTMVLNKKYNKDYSSENVKLVMNVYDINGVQNQALSISQEFNIPHFSMTGQGCYYRGKEVSLKVDTSSISGDYYIIAYVEDQSGNLVSNVGSFVSINGIIQRSGL